MAAHDLPAHVFTLRPPPHSQQVERIEYPARIVHVDRAVATLGGAAQLAKQLSTKKAGASSKEPVQLSLNLGLAIPQPTTPDSMHTTSLLGDSTASRGFLLCVQVDDTGTASDVSVVASYERTHSFHRLADFVYRRDAPSAALHVATPGVINGASPSFAQLEALGPYKMPTPHRFNLMDTTALVSSNLFYNQDVTQAPVMQQTLESEFKSVRPKCLSIDQRCDVTPVDPPVPLHQLHLTASEQEFLTKLFEMFAHQPVWTRRGICRSLGLNDRQYGLSAEFLKLLGSVSYRFLDGPFHNSYIRLGYDPRQPCSPDSAGQSPAWNQPIAVRISSAVWGVFMDREPQFAAPSVDDAFAAAGDAAAAGGASAVRSAHDAALDTDIPVQKPWLQVSPEDALLVPPKHRSFSIIPVIVRHPLLEKWKAGACTLPAFDHTNGWFSSEALDAVRDIVERALHSMLTAEELRKLAVLERMHVGAADGRKGRKYTSLLRRKKGSNHMRRSLEYRRENIERLASLAPLSAATAGSSSVNPSRPRNPAAAAPSSTSSQTKQSQQPPSTISDASSKSNSGYISSQNQNVMSQLSDISNLAVIATQDSGSDYDVFSGSSSDSSDSGGGSSDGSDA